MLITLTRHFISQETTCVSQTFTENLPLLGKGNSEFIPHNELMYDSDKNTECLQHDCLSFRVNKVSILPTPKIPELPPWATEKCVCHFVTSFAFSKKKLLHFMVLLFIHMIEDISFLLWLILMEFTREKVPMYLFMLHS